MMFEGECHCGAVKWRFQGAPEKLVDCNCSICRRLRPLWGHGTDANISIDMVEGATIAYIWGDKALAFHTCRTCGCTTHWQGLAATSPQNMAVNFALAKPADVAKFRIRRFDGADTWTFLN